MRLKPVHILTEMEQCTVEKRLPRITWCSYRAAFWSQTGTEAWELGACFRCAGAALRTGPPPSARQAVCDSLRPQRTAFGVRCGGPFGSACPRLDSLFVEWLMFVRVKKKKRLFKSHANHFESCKSLVPAVDAVQGL